MDGDDNTAVLNIKQGFRELIGSRYDRQAGCKRKFGESFLSRSRLNDSDSPDGRDRVSMKTIVDSQKEEHAREVELVRTRAQVTKLEAELSQAEVAHKSMKINYDRQTQELKQHLQRSKDKLVEVSRQLTSVSAREAECKRKLAENRAAADTSLADTDKRVLVLQREKYQLQTRLSELTESTRNNVTEMKNTQLRQCTELQICRDQLTDNQEQLQAANRRCKELGEQVHELEQLQHRALKDSHRIQELEQKLARIEEEEVHTQAMRSQLSQLSQLQAENRRLQDDINYCRETEENTLLLKEEVRSLTSKAEKCEEKGQRIAQLQIENQELKKRIADMSGTPTGLNMSASELRDHVGELQSSNAILLQQQAQFKASSSAKEKQCANMEQQLSASQAQLAAEQEMKTQLESHIKRLKRKLLLLTKERDSYKTVIDSYESEVTVNIASMTSQRLAQLEHVNTGYHKQLSDAEVEIQRLNQLLLQARHKHIQGEVGSGSRVTATPVVDDKLVVSLREKIASLEAVVEKLKEEKEILDMRLERHNLQGDYDPTKTKVVHLAMNPLELARRRRALQIDSLTEENARLKERLKVLEESGGKIQDVTMQVEKNLQDKPETSKELEEIRQQVNSAELKNKRLVEAFKKTSQEFREVVYQLLGYRIDIPTQNQYKLMSMYSESSEDFLLFQQSGGGEMQMLESTFSASVEDNMRTYLHGANSIPGFLSSLTIDGLTKQTMLSESTLS